MNRPVRAMKTPSKSVASGPTAERDLEGPFKPYPFTKPSYSDLARAASLAPSIHTTSESIRTGVGLGPVGGGVSTTNEHPECLNSPPAGPGWIELASGCVACLFRNAEAALVAASLQASGTGPGTASAGGDAVGGTIGPLCCSAHFPPIHS